MTEQEIIPQKVLNEKRILSTLEPNLDIYGHMTIVKLFSSDITGKNWLNSDIQGYLCLILDYHYKTIYIRIYDTITYQILFQYELYKNFLKLYQELAKDFRCFEIDSGFIGIKFDTEKEAKSFDGLIRGISDRKTEYFSKPKPKIDEKENIQKSKEYIEALKRKFLDGEAKYDENYIKEGIDILKFDNFQMMDNISYDKEAKQYKFGKISPELKELFRSFGIKKKVLESNANLAFMVLSTVIVGLGNDQDTVKNPSIERIEHYFPRPAEKEKIWQNEDAEEAKSFFGINPKVIRKTKGGQQQNNDSEKKNQTTIQPETNNMIYENETPTEEDGYSIPPPPQIPNDVPNFSNYAPQTSSDIPEPPSDIPLPPPMIPEIVPNREIENNNQDNNIPVGVSSREEEVKKLLKGGLKKVVVEEKKTENKFDDNTKSFLKKTLELALKQRVDFLNMHNDDNKDNEDDDDWD